MYEYWCSVVRFCALVRTEFRPVAWGCPGDLNAQHGVAVRADPCRTPAAFAAAAGQAAALRRASGVMSAHSAEQIITVVTVVTADRPSPVAVALAVVAEVVGRPATSASQ